MKNFKNMLKQAQQMQEKLKHAQEKLADLEVEGSSGGGMVKVTVSGRGQMRKLSLDKALIDPNDVEVLEDLIVAAFNDAKAKADDLSEETMGSVTGDIPLPKGFNLPF